VKPERRPRKGHTENEFVKAIRFFLFGVITWFVASTASELIGNQMNATAVGQKVGRIILAAAVVVVPLILVVWLILYLRARGRDPDEATGDSEQLAPLEPPVWHRPAPLYDRDEELLKAVQLVLAHGVVAVVGPRDIGTTAVAETVAQKLIDEHDAQAEKTVRFDLRGRSTRRPDDARATAGRILSSFGLDEPADDTAEVLANAARRLVRLFSRHYDTLMLDNVSVPEQVSWLVREWPFGTRQRLILAGGTAISSVVEDCTVPVGELGLLGLREIWYAELDEPDSPRIPRLPWRWGRRNADTGTGMSDNVKDLLTACFGRPRAVKAFAQEIRRPGSTVTVESLLMTVRSDGPVDGQLERVWTAILDHIRDELSAPAVWLLHALAELPVTDLTSGTIAAMAARHSEPADDPLEELRTRNLVQKTKGRYRMPSEVRRAIIGTTKEADRRAVALEAIPALLRHYVEQTDQWAVRHDPAQRWFHDEEPSLRPLFSPENYLDERLLALVIEDLPRIADALETWYVREQQSSGLLTVNRGLRTLAEQADRPGLAGLAAIRMATAHRMAGQLGEASEMLNTAAELATRLRDNRAAAELNVREHVERALLGMTGALDPEALHRAEIELSRILAPRRARPTVSGVTSALINLGALCVQQSRPVDAREHLRRAEKLADGNGDIGSQAHAIELQGVAVSQQSDELHDAVELWQRAKERFIRIGDEQGEARCLQHLGSAALVDSKVAGQLRDGRPHALDKRAAADVALPLLERSKRLRAGQPDTTLVDHYLAKARERLELPGEE
jgi:tetratricopeptide (TPR) repeat protein